MVTVDRANVEARERAGDHRAGGVLKALRTLSFQLSGAQLGITVTSLVVGFLAEPALASLLRGPLTSLGLPAGAAAPLAVVIAMLVATVLQMVFGELVPKNLAIRQAVRGGRHGDRVPARVLAGHDAADPGAQRGGQPARPAAARAPPGGAALGALPRGAGVADPQVRGGGHPPRPGRLAGEPDPAVR